MNENNPVDSDDVMRERLLRKNYICMKVLVKMNLVTLLIVPET